MTDLKLLSGCRYALLAMLLGAATASAQPEITYLPSGAKYDPAIPTPKAHFGFEIGQRHLYHHELIGYFKKLAELSPRATLTEYARSYGGRPLVILTITSPPNHQRLEAVRQRHLQLADPATAAGVNLDDLPAVLNMGYGVHGNEASAFNVAPLVAYHLVAGQGPAHDKRLSELVILLDPCLNPDGNERFAHWANNHKGKVPNPDPQHREHREGWPNGRTNYYGFDLNRDWLPAAHPESQGRLAFYHRWKPNVVLDYHEMGTDQTYFFQPGVFERTNPLTPRRNVELTRQFAKFHAQTLDDAGRIYFTEERFDDFYMGKGSTYPDLHGAVGILFEQGSARGHVQESVHGKITFPFAIKNQFLTSLSSLEATQSLRKELLAAKRDFYQDAAALAKNAQVSGYLVAAPHDPVRLHRFLQTLALHDIDAYQLKSDWKVEGRSFHAGQAYVIPVEQPEFRFLASLFEKRTDFKENIFYDVSTWTLPLAYHLDYVALTDSLADAKLGPRFDPQKLPQTSFTPAKDDIAYAIDWRSYAAPRTLYRLLEAEAMVKVAQQPFTLSSGESFPWGTLVVPLGLQTEKRDSILALLKQAAGEGVRVVPVKTGLTRDGIDLGSNDMRVLKKPKVLLAVGSGTSTYQAGAAWHLLDRRVEMPVTLVDTHRLAGADLADYSTIVLVSGSYSPVNQAGVDKLKEWVQGGGTLIAMGSACRFVDRKEIADVRFREPPKEDSQPPGNGTPKRRPYADAERQAAFKLVRGSIFATDVDRTHPVGYGYDDRSLPVFRNSNLMLEPSANPYSTPVVYAAEPLLSGYISEENLKRVSGSASVVVGKQGRGRIVLIGDSPNFRAFWYGTNRLFLNTIFFGALIEVPQD